MNRNYSVSHVRLWIKTLSSFLVIMGYYSLFKEIAQSTFKINDFQDLNFLICEILLLVFAIFIWTYSFKVDEIGITQSYGIELKSGKIIGWKLKYPWKSLEIRLWSSWNPSVAIDKSRVPKIWWAINTNYNQCMRMIAKYGKDRMMDEDTRNYFRKFEGI